LVINDDDNVISNPDGSIASADGSVISLGRRATSSSADIVSLSYLMKIPVIFFASAYGVTIPLPKTNVLSYAENIFVHRSLLTMHRDIRKKDNSFVLREGKTNILDREINKKANFMVSMGKWIAIPYERTASLPRTLFKSYDEITSVYEKTATAYFFVPLYMYM